MAPARGGKNGRSVVHQAKPSMAVWWRNGPSSVTCSDRFLGVAAQALVGGHERRRLFANTGQALLDAVASGDACGTAGMEGERVSPRCRPLDAPTDVAETIDTLWVRGDG